MKWFWDRKPKSNLFKPLEPYEFILVVGPQRAGTTITAAMIANDLDYEYLEEIEVWGWMGQDAPKPPAPRNWSEFFSSRLAPCVIHCPEHTAYVHGYAGLGNVAVVMVVRGLDLIERSAHRVGWGFEKHELAHYPGYKSPVAKAKYDFWREYQKELLGDQAFEIRYDSLKDHPMWLEDDKRKGFAIAQAEEDKPRGDFVQNPKLTGAQC